MVVAGVDMLAAAMVEMAAQVADRVLALAGLLTTAVQEYLDKGTRAVMVVIL
jgi:hypothetical protein